jgi:hypothetical protein
LEVVTYSVASLCGLLLIFLVLRYRHPISRVCCIHHKESSQTGISSTSSSSESCSSYIEANNKSVRTFTNIPCCQDSVNHIVKTNNIQLMNNNISVTSSSSRTSFSSEKDSVEGHKTETYQLEYINRESPSLCVGEYNPSCGYCQHRHCYQHNIQTSYQLQQQLIYGHQANRYRPPSQASVIGSDV